MPHGDGTGPNGMGPMTGRAAGFCAGNDMQMNQGGGRGRGCRHGRGGFGRRNMLHATGLTGRERMALAAGQLPVAETLSREQHAAALKAQAEMAERSLADLRDRIAALEKEAR